MENEHQTVFSPHLRASLWLRWCWFTSYTHTVKDKTASTPPQLPGVCLVPNSRQMSTITSSPLNRPAVISPSFSSVSPSATTQSPPLLHICFLPSHYPEFFFVRFFPLLLFCLFSVSQSNQWIYRSFVLLPPTPGSQPYSEFLMLIIIPSQSQVKKPIVLLFCSIT